MGVAKQIENDKKKYNKQIYNKGDLQISIGPEIITILQPL